jgi:hypothetical protein
LKNLALKNFAKNFASMTPLDPPRVGAAPGTENSRQLGWAADMVPNGARAVASGLGVVEPRQRRKDFYV